MTVPAAQADRRHSPWLVLSVLCLGFFMILLDTTIVNIAIPSISDKLHASLSDILWILNSYVLVYAVFVAFGVYYIYKLLREGPTGAAVPIPGATPNRPMAFADDAASATGTNLSGKR